MNRRRLAVGSLVLGSVLFVTGSVGLTGVLADEGDPGSSFGSLNLVGTASAFRLVGLNSNGQEAEGQVPYSTASLSIGGYGHALSSVFWPGGTAGNAGTTIGLLGNPACAVIGQVNPFQTAPPCPPPPVPVTEKYPLLNDPLKVESQTNSGDPVDTLDYGQGAALMSASATSTDVKAEAGVAGAYVTGIGTVGQTNSIGHTQLTGVSAAVSDASSQVRSVDIGKGVFKIGSVQSTAHAETNGVTSSGSATTVVSNFTIAGVPVTVDENGLHVQKSGGSTKAANDAVNEALSSFGMQIFLTQPTHTTSGPTTTYNSGNLILAFYQADYNAQANQDGNVVVLGGATVTASAGPGFWFNPPPIVTVPPPAGLPPGTITPPGTGTGTGTGTPGGFNSGTTAPPAVAPGQPVVQLAGQPLKDFAGLSPWWAVLVLGGVGFMAAGFRRLPDRVLESAGISCPLED